MTRILLIVFGSLAFGALLFCAAYGIAWLVGRWQQHEQRKHEQRKPPTLRFYSGGIVEKYRLRDDGKLAERRRTLDRVMKANEPPYTAMSARRQNAPQAAGLDTDRKRVN